MRLISLPAIALVLAFCGSVAPQPGRLVQHNTKDDPCGRFKMRIVVPANVDDQILPVKSFSGGVDAGMVWNPCTNGEPQIATTFSNSTPEGTRFLFSKSAFPVQPSTGQNAQVAPEELFSLSSPSPRLFMKRRP